MEIEFRLCQSIKVLVATVRSCRRDFRHVLRDSGTTLLQCYKLLACGEKASDRCADKARSTAICKAGAMVQSDCIRHPSARGDPSPGAPSSHPQLQHHAPMSRVFANVHCHKSPRPVNLNLLGPSRIRKDTQEVS